MKKIITLLLAVGSVAALHAQTSREEARRVILGQPKESSKTTTTSPSSTSPRDVILGGGNGSYPSSYPGTSSGSTREARINQVNREYDSKIQSIRNNPYLSQAEKDRAIRQLEADRARRIREINGGYYDNDGYAKRKNKDYKSYQKGNNGKHLGWEKGKGNPHKNGGKSNGKKG